MNNKDEGMTMKPAHKDGFAPELRFPDFQQKTEWQEMLGNQLFEQIIDKKPGSSLPILAITQEHGAIPRELIDYHVSVTDKSIENYKVVNAGDFIISLRSFQGGIEYSKYNGICSPAYVVLRRSGEGDDAFFKQYLKTDRFIQSLAKNLEGLRDGKMISYRQFSDLVIPVPTTQEQKKIAGILNSIDERIDLERLKLKTLKAHKKGLMQKLFPSENETQPLLRFPEFRQSEEWSTTSLGEICDMRAGKFIVADEIFQHKADDMYPCYGGNGLRGYTKTYTHSGCYSLIGRQGALCGNVSLVDGCFYATEHAVVTTPRAGVHAEWLFYTLSLLNLNRFATGQAQPGLSVDALNKVSCAIPRELEQIKIASCLSSLDKRIKLETQRLDTLKTYKKGLMQQMFPQVGETDA